MPRPFKILILKPSSLGDVIHALPVLRLLKLHLRDAEIYWWIDASLAPLLEGDPDLTGIVRFERKRWSSPPGWPEMFRSVLWMRAQKFDWVIDLQGLLRSALFGWLARGKIFVGLDNRFEGGREGANAFYDVAVQSGDDKHAVERCLSVLPALEVPVHTRFQWLPERPQVAAGINAKWPEAGASRWIAIQPGARWPTKCWPTQNFADLVRLLAQKFPDVRFAVMGSEADKVSGQTISFGAPGRVLNLCGQTSLPEMVEWLRLCDLMITNDTGPMHAAAALGAPVVALFGPTDPRFTGPYGQLENVLRIELPCAPCFKSYCAWKNPLECLTAITPPRVFEFAEKKLADGAKLKR
ncbi:MAG TPA: lipopolysaccharide heptosyltransferase II [Candidatus Acidoferrum sp.]|nr:lipopolysaccharide heptosyltransferase II [Candidatus Acidoferrum sp.]